MRQRDLTFVAIGLFFVSLFMTLAIVDIKNTSAEEIGKLHKEVKELNTELNKSEKQHAEFKAQTGKEINNLKNENILLKKQVSNHAKRLTASRGGGNRRFVGTWEITAYTPSKDETDGNPWETASGKRLVPNYTLAIDNDHWKFGTKFYIEGIGIVEAMDTGVSGRRSGDLAVLTKKQAFAIGRTHRKVWVIE